jgi:hypothetical protein
MQQNAVPALNEDSMRQRKFACKALVGVGIGIFCLLLLPAIITSMEKTVESHFDQGPLMGAAAFAEFMDRRAGNAAPYASNVVATNQPLAEGVWSSQSADVAAFNANRTTEATTLQDENKDWYCSAAAQVFVSTDKPMYNPGDIVFVHAYLMTVDTKLPLLVDNRTEALIAPASTIVQDKDDTTVFTAMAAEAVDGTYAQAIKIPHNVRGGEYTIKISSLSNRVFKSGSRKIRIMDTQQPDLLVSVDYNQANYLPGETLTAKATIKRVDGAKLAVGSSITIKYQG